jgi:hypothetical protein
MDMGQIDLAEIFVSEALSLLPFSSSVLQAWYRCVCVDVWIYVQACIYIYVCMDVCVYFIDIYIRVCKIFMYTCSYTYTYTGEHVCRTRMCQC